MCHHYTNYSISFIPPLTFGQQHIYYVILGVKITLLTYLYIGADYLPPKGFCYRGTKWWNMLPDIIVNLSYSEFAPAVYEHLMREDG